jgi:hypothetical protein
MLCSRMCLYSVALSESMEPFSLGPLCLRYQWTKNYFSKNHYNVPRSLTARAKGITQSFNRILDCVAISRLLMFQILCHNGPNGGSLSGQKNFHNKCNFTTRTMILIPKALRDSSCQLPSIQWQTGNVPLLYLHRKAEMSQTTLIRFVQHFKWEWTCEFL